MIKSIELHNTPLNIVEYLKQNQISYKCVPVMITYIKQSQ